MKPNIPGYIGVMPEHEDMKYLLRDDAISQGFGILAMRRMGKSNLAGVIMEIMLLVNDQIIVIDPPGAHVGIRNMADPKTGQPAGPSNLNILIVGGENADIPLDPHGGRALAQVLMETKMSCVINLKGTRMRERKDFLTDFGEELYAHNKTPLHVFLEEADETIPQQPDNREEQAIRHIWRQLIKGGGQQGIGFTIITQRPAMVDKTSLYQVDNLFVMGLLGAGDVDTLEKWFKHNTASDEERKAILRSLSDLQPGEAWLLSPKWLKAMVRINVRPRATYHAGRTPKRGETVAVMQRYSLGDVVAKVQGLMEAKGVEASLPEERANKAQAALLEQELQLVQKDQRLEELRHNLQEAQQLNAELGGEADRLRRERDEHVCAGRPIETILVETEHRNAETVLVQAETLLRQARDHINKAGEQLADAKREAAGDTVEQERMDPAFTAEALRKPEQVSQRTHRFPMSDNFHRPPSATAHIDLDVPGNVASRPTVTATQNGALPEPSVAVLRELAIYYPKYVSKKRVAAALGTTADKSTWRGWMAPIRQAGNLVTENGSELALTGTGKQLYGADVRGARTTRDVLSKWEPKLSSSAWRMLEALLAYRGQFVDRELVGQKIGVDPKTSTWRGHAAELRAADLIVDQGTKMAANKETLFL